MAVTPCALCEKIHRHNPETWTWSVQDPETWIFCECSVPETGISHKCPVEDPQTWILEDKPGFCASALLLPYHNYSSSSMPLFVAPCRFVVRLCTSKVLRLCTLPVFVCARQKCFVCARQCGCYLGFSTEWWKMFLL